LLPGRSRGNLISESRIMLRSLWLVVIKQDGKKLN
jgi:hypothetical protein